MSLINKIKEFFKGKEEKSLDVPIKESSLEEVPLKLEEESKEITTSKKQLKERLYNNIKDFELKIDDVILSLEEIDISEKKEHDKIKLVVNESLNQYITYLKRTIEILSKIDKSKRPRKRITLSQHVSTIFQKKLNDSEIDKIIDYLFIEKLVSETGGKLSYNF